MELKGELGVADKVPQETEGQLPAQLITEIKKAVWATGLD